MDYWRKDLHYPLTRAMHFSPMLPTLCCLYAWFTKGGIFLLKSQVYKYFILIHDAARSILSSISYWYEHICSWSLPVSVFHKGFKEHTILPHCPWKWIGLPICDYFMIDNAFFKTIYNDTKGPTGISFIDLMQFIVI